jgi:hypothetical protein
MVSVRGTTEVKTIPFETRLPLKKVTAENQVQSSLQRLDEGINAAANVYFCVPFDPSRLKTAGSTATRGTVAGESTDSKHRDGWPN